MEELKPCPLCGEPLIIRKSIVGGEEHFVAYCHCGFEFADDCSMEDFVKECNRRAAPENNPLTLEQLRQMDGEPVFVASPGAEEYGHWVIVAGVDDTDGDKTLYCNGDFTCRDYGKTWLAYARRPEGSEP